MRMERPQCRLVPTGRSQCANSGPSPTALRTGQVDPKRPANGPRLLGFDPRAAKGRKGRNPLLLHLLDPIFHHSIPPMSFRFLRIFSARPYENSGRLHKNRRIAAFAALCGPNFEEPEIWGHWRGDASCGCGVVARRAGVRRDNVSKATQPRTDPSGNNPSPPRTPPAADSQGSQRLSADSSAPRQRRSSLGRTLLRPFSPGTRTDRVSVPRKAVRIGR